MTTDFGCAYCYGEDAQAVWTYHRNGGLEPQRRIVDDPQYSDVVPVTPAEAATVLEQGEQVDLRYLGSLGEGRRRLSSDWPTGGETEIGWRVGTFWVEQGH